MDFDQKEDLSQELCKPHQQGVFIKKGQYNCSSFL